MKYKELLNSLKDNSSVRQLSDSELKELQLRMLSCYKDISLVCEKYNLSLMLGGGTCIGAVRHKGYIPWDDDFDLMISRKDYNVLQKIFENELGSKYILDAPNYSKYPSARFARILIKNTCFVEIGQILDERSKIKLDLFIIENVPQNIMSRFVHGFICMLVMYITGQVETYEERKSSLFNVLKQTKKGRFTFYKRIFVGKLFSFFPAYKWHNIVDRTCQYKNSNSEFVSIPTGRKHYFGELQRKDVFFPISKGKFENIEATLPHNPDAYLTKLYGNYMEIPPEDKREKHLIEDIKFNC